MKHAFDAFDAFVSDAALAIGALVFLAILIAWEIVSRRGAR
jgi:hypothetical protein